MVRQTSDTGLQLTVFQRFSPFRAERSFLFWLALFVITALLSFYLSQTLPEDQAAFRGLAIYQAAGLFLVPLGVREGYRIFIEWASRLGNFVEHEHVSEWFVDELSFVRGNWLMALSGFGLGTVSLLAFHHGGYFDSYPPFPYFVVSLIMFVSASFAGIGLYLMFCVSRALWRLALLPGVRIKVRRHRFGVMSTGATLFKCWMIIACIWAVYVASAFVGFPGEDYESIMHRPPMWLLAYPTFPLIVGSFIICQIPLHRRMVEYKREELMRLDRMLDEIQPVTATALDENLRDNIEFLDRQKNQYRALPEWPFSLVSLLGTGASSVTAIFPVLFMEGIPEWISPLTSW